MGGSINMEDKQTNIEIGARIRSLRIKQGIKSSELALKLNISPQSLTLIQSGKIALSVGRLKEVAQALGVMWYEVLGFDTSSLCHDKTVNLTKEIQEYQDKYNKSQDQVILLQQKLLTQQRNNNLK